MPICVFTPVTRSLSMINLQQPVEIKKALADFQVCDGPPVYRESDPPERGSHAQQPLLNGSGYETGCPPHLPQSKLSNRVHPVLRQDELFQSRQVKDYNASALILPGYASTSTLNAPCGHSQKPLPF